jgi:parallel beta-helix repeat protein
MNPIINTNILNFENSNPNNFQEVERIENIHVSDYWDENEVKFIHIDNNWTDAANDLAWVQGGDGSWSDPYIIENVTINGENSRTCVKVENSNDYFIIRNCTLYNSGESFFEDKAGILLNNVNNGSIIKNNCSNNYGYGIYLKSSNNNTISYNMANDNENAEGIRLSSSSNNTILYNIANNNKYAGIYVGLIGVSQYHYNNLSGNTVKNNKYYGIALDGSNNNTVFNNSAINNGDNGITLRASRYNKIIENNISSNKWNGIELQPSGSALDPESNNNTIKRNIINNNSRYGIYFINSSSTLVKGNILNENDYGCFHENDYSYHNEFIWNICNYSCPPILIDDTGVSGDFTWEEAATDFAWCTGSGTSEDPYVIKDLIINGQNETSCISIINSYKYFIINNCKVFNASHSPEHAGIKLKSTHNGTLVNNTCISNNYDGIQLRYYSTHNSVVGNNLNNNRQNGIYVSYSDNNLISENTANNNTAYGLFLYFSGNNSISGNLFTHIGSSYFMYLYHGDNNNITKNILISNTAHGGCLRVSFSNNNTIIGNIINDNVDGCYDEDNSENTTFLWNVCDGYSDSFILDDSGNSGNFTWSEASEKLAWCTGSGDIDDPYIFENLKINGQNETSSIFINNSQKYFIIRNCWLYNSSDSSDASDSAGVKLYNTTYGMLTNNSFFDNYNGILGLDMDNSSISNNTIYNNDNGIFLGYDCNDNTLVKNIIRNNNKIGAFTGNLSMHLPNSGNIFYTNIFFENILNAMDNATNNQWDNGSLGNDWDDYTGKDQNDDGIGDTPYLIPGTAENQDNFPIFDDGLEDFPPNIVIHAPISNEAFGEVPPAFNVTITDTNLDKMWYTINLSTTKYFFTTNTSIDLSAWNELSNGFLILAFYANDTSGGVNSKQVIIKKEIAQDLPPTIIIHSPGANEIFGEEPPTFNVTIMDTNLDKMWYTLNQNNEKYFFVSNTSIDSNAWNSLSDGSIIINFYANDTAGNSAHQEVTIVKDTYTPPPEPEIPGYNLIILILGIFGISIVFLIRKKIKFKS